MILDHLIKSINAHQRDCSTRRLPLETGRPIWTAEVQRVGAGVAAPVIPTSHPSLPSAHEEEEPTHPRHKFPNTLDLPPNLPQLIPPSLLSVLHPFDRLLDLPHDPIHPFSIPLDRLGQLRSLFLKFVEETGGFVILRG